MFNSVVIYLHYSPCLLWDQVVAFPSAQVILQHSQLDEEHLTTGGICVNRLLFENNLGSDAIELLGGGPHSFAFLVLRGAEATRRHHSPLSPQTIAKLCMCRRYGMW